MPTIDVVNMQGKATGTMELSDTVFGIEPNVPAMHLVVRSYLAAQRQGTQSTLTRSMVRGGGRKMYRQKGTGRARHHGSRAPQFCGVDLSQVDPVDQDGAFGRLVKAQYQALNRGLARPHPPDKRDFFTRLDLE